MASAQAQVVLDRDARLVLANRHASDQFDIRAQDVGCPVEELGLSRLPVDLRARLADARDDDGSLWLHDLTLPGKDSATYDVEVVPLAEGWTLVLHDISRLRRVQAELGRADQGLASAYEELRRGNAELEQTNEELHEAVEALQACHDALTRRGRSS